MRGFGRLNNSPFFLAAGTIYYVGLPLAVFAAGSGLYRAVRRDRLALLMGLSAVLPLLLIMGISLVQYTANRYVFFSLFSWLVLAGLGFAGTVAAAGQGQPGVGAGGRRRTAGRICRRSVCVLHAAKRQPRRLAGGLCLCGGARPARRPGCHDFVRRICLLPGRAIRLSALGTRRKLPQDSGTHTWYIEDMTVAELYPQQLAAMEEHAAAAGGF